MSMQRVLGFVLLLAGGAVAVIVCRVPIGHPLVFRSLAAACPFLTILGLAMVAWKSPYQERADRAEDMWEMSGLRVVTRRWWMAVLVAIGLAAGGYFVPPELIASRAGIAIQSAHNDSAKK